MATYYQGVPESQQEGLQTLYLMNSGYLGYPADAALPSTNMVFVNSIANQLNQANFSAQQFVGTPLQSQYSVPVSVMDVTTAAQGILPRVQYNLWNPMPSNGSLDLSTTSHQLGIRRRISNPSVPQPQQKGLSLSLTPHQSIQQPFPLVNSTEGGGGGGGGEQEHARFLSLPSSATVNGIAGSQQEFLMGSKFLKVTQQLLEEVVSVGKDVKEEPTRIGKATSLTKGNQESELEGISGVGCGHGGTNEKRLAFELTTAERQGIQMKKAKLLNMLDEVEQRYRQYHQQMQLVVSSFEAIAGTRSARTYTALALQTISKQFRWLRDAISGQISCTAKILGEENSILGRSKLGTVSRLRFVDHQLRQQKALQQLGMMQPQNNWRPQRGLPERSVSILRAWLFENFLHPYPKDSDKHMLAKETGLTRNQVSNWFINARVRLWKPMVEEMYMEETKNQQKDTRSTRKSEEEEENSLSKSFARPPTPPSGGGSPEIDPILTPTSKVSRLQVPGYLDEDDLVKKRRKIDVRSVDDSSIPLETTNAATNNINLFTRFGSYSNGEIPQPFGTDRYHSQQQQQYSANDVSLTLGLQHSDGLTLSGALPAYLPTSAGTDDDGNLAMMGPPYQNGYESFKLTMEALVGRR